jgi:hypothetical protein
MFALINAYSYIKYKTVQLQLPRSGVTRPLMYPPPMHLSCPPTVVEVAVQEPGAADYKKRLEERAREMGSSAADRAGNLVFDDTAAYVEPV